MKTRTLEIDLNGRQLNELIGLFFTLMRHVPCSYDGDEAETCLSARVPKADRCVHCDAEAFVLRATAKSTTAKLRKVR